MRKNKFLPTAMLLIVALGKAQFNTVKYAPPPSKKSEVNQKAEAPKIMDDLTAKKMSRKERLQHSLDSLRTEIRAFHDQSKANANAYKRMRDSLLLVASLRQSFSKDEKKPAVNKQVKTFDFISEPIMDTERLISKMSMPIDGKMNITSGFGSRVHPVLGYAKMHFGIDIAAAYQKVRSVLDGTVTEVGYDSASGNFMKVRHSDKYETSYSHLSEMYYRTGDKVKAGYIIAKSGNTGRSTGPHLHFAVKENGQFINPLKFLNQLISVNNILANIN